MIGETSRMILSGREFALIWFFNDVKNIFSICFTKAFLHVVENKKVEATMFKLFKLNKCWKWKKIDTLVDVRNGTLYF